MLGGIGGAQADVIAPVGGGNLGSLDLVKPNEGMASDEVDTSPKMCTQISEGANVESDEPTTACMAMAPLENESGIQARAMADDDEVVGSCSLVPGSWTYQRMSYCLGGSQITYTEYNRNNPSQILGSAILEVSSSGTLSSRSGRWEEVVTVKLASVKDQVTSLAVAFKASCSTGCTAATPNPWAGSRLLSVGQSVSGSVFFEDTPASGGISTVTTSYVATVTQPGTTPLNPDVSWTNPRDIRCDTTFAKNTSTGCAIPSVRASLKLSLAKYGAAAALYGFAQQQFTQHWGATDSPLMREANEAVHKQHRNDTCEGGASRPFTYLLANVPDDSCDEYPFAATHEGGSNGGLCADIVPLLQNGTWRFYQDPNAPAVTFNEPCVRGHVPETLNEAAGGALGNNSLNQRVLDLEKFTVAIVA
ncbi:hypothetical protein JCM9957A_11110 [Kineosporia succinea]